MDVLNAINNLVQAFFLLPESKIEHLELRPDDIKQIVTREIIAGIGHEIEKKLQITETGHPEGTAYSAMFYVFTPDEMHKFIKEIETHARNQR